MNYSEGCVYHQFVILSKKEKFIRKLFESNNIQYGKHYPKPIHKLKAVSRYFKNEKYPNAEKFSKYGLSLPIDPNLKKYEINKILKFLIHFNFSRIFNILIGLIKIHYNFLNLYVLKILSFHSLKENSF